MLQTAYRRGTKDSDVLETQDLDAATQRHLRALAGNGSPLHGSYRLYLEVVPAGLPFLPQACRWHPQTVLNARLTSFEVAALDVTDVVVSKLKRFSASDANDVEAMVTNGHVKHDELVARFLSAVDVCSHGANGTDLPEYVDNLHRVERDFFGVTKTDVELPPWCER